MPAQSHVIADNSNLNTNRPTFVSQLECGMTGQELTADILHNLSPEGWPILVRYDLEALGKAVDRDALAARPAGLWRYRELLPVRKVENIVSLGEIATPLVSLDRIAAENGLAGLIVKDEGRLPTGSFKARGLCLAVCMGKELGVTRMAMPTNGNAGSALAAYCSRAGIESYVFCPDDTPEVNMREIAIQGAKLFKVNGLINDCGKKTMGLELADQMGWTLPDVIFYPTGGGTGLIGMWKAFAELEALGWITGKKPRMVAVQAAGCAPMVKAYEDGVEHAEVWQNAHTVAAGIRVPAAIGDFLILRAVRESNGFAIAVEDDAIEAARLEVATKEGLLMCPEGAATYAAYKKALNEGRVHKDETAVLYNCASGLKYPLPAAGTDLDRTKPIDYAALG